jgi:formylglycine-generating enzyme required for sulfatase activity
MKEKRQKENNFEVRLKAMNKIAEKKGYLNPNEILTTLKKLGAEKDFESNKFSRPLIIKDHTSSPEMTLIKGGAFMMGSTNEVDIYANNYEKPARLVTIKPFFISTFPITQLEWLEVMGTMPSEIWGRKLPVTNVSWNDCQIFVEKLSNLTQRSYRFPTEAEWEFSAKANSSTTYHHGDDETQLELYTCINCDSLQQVGTKLPNQLGLHDMHGLVEQWVQDTWHENYEGAPVDGSAWEDPLTKWKVCRGDSWRGRPRDVRSANRSYFSASQAMDYNGFRVARD